MPSLTRVTQGTISLLTTQGLQDALSRVQSMQERLATGKQISRPSDDPGGTVAALNYRADIRRTEQYTRNAENGQVNRNIAPGVQVTVNVNGPQVFGSGAAGLFTVLDKISQDLRAGTTASVNALTQTDLGNLDAATTQVQNTLAVVGARYDRVQTMKNLHDTTVVNLKSGLSEVEDADLPKTITDLQLQQVSYQAALAASAKVIQPSLVDFLR